MLAASVFGLFGLIVGSFLNVIILRHGVRSIGGRSGCMSCGRQLLWYDMIPVLSWVLLRGRCRGCAGSISLQYPLVEAATGVLFASIGAVPFFGIFYKILFCIIAAILVCITVYDFLHTIIPDSWAYVFDALAFLVMGPVFLVGQTPPLLYLLAGPLAALPLFALWLFSQGKWMGLGDAKLALGIGWLLGPALGLFAIFGAFVIGAIVSVGILLPLPHITRALYTSGITLRQKPAGGFTMKSEIPFGPFLILSCIIIWFATLYGIDPLQAFGLLP